VLGAALACASAVWTATPSVLASRTPDWKLIPRSGLTVTEGTVTSAGPKALLETKDPGMRATARDDGRHARDARVWFRYLGESTTTEPLGSGLIRRQIGLKLRAPDPCNLVYVMWHQFPDNAIQVQVKRNPGQTTSAECGNRGYTTIATIPLGEGDSTDDHSAHRLQAETRRSPNGALILTLYTDGSLLRKLRISAALTAGLQGPIGIRSDNGHYLFRLSGRR
jgi:hypothetical protein